MAVPVMRYWPWGGGGLTDGEGATFCLFPLASGEGLQSLPWGDSVRTEMVLFSKTKRLS